jgi:hypothetical protein
MVLKVSSVVIVALIALVHISFRIRETAPPDKRVSNSWRPFLAEFRVVAEDGALISRGRYWRTRDGSDRRERDSLDTAETIHSVQIRRISDRSCYRFSQAAGWTVQPMLLPEVGWLPPSYPPRDDARPIRIENLSAQRLSTAQGDYIVRVPALNFFRLIRFTAASGRREEYFNVVLEEPDSHLLAPPIGSSVRRLPEPACIIDRTLSATSAGSADDH